MAAARSDATGVVRSNGGTSFEDAASGLFRMMASPVVAGGKLVRDTYRDTAWALGGRQGPRPERETNRWDVADVASVVPVGRVGRTLLQVSPARTGELMREGVAAVAAQYGGLQYADEIARRVRNLTGGDAAARIPSLMRNAGADLDQLMPVSEFTAKDLEELAKQGWRAPDAAYYPATSEIKFDPLMPQEAARTSGVHEGTHFVDNNYLGDYASKEFNIFDWDSTVLPDVSDLMHKPEIAALSPKMWDYLRKPTEILARTNEIRHSINPSDDLYRVVTPKILAPYRANPRMGELDMYSFVSSLGRNKTEVETNLLRLLNTLPQAGGVGLLGALAAQNGSPVAARQRQ